MLETTKNETTKHHCGSEQSTNSTRPENNGRHANRNVSGTHPIQTMINGFMAFLGCISNLFRTLRERCCFCCPPDEQAVIPSSGPTFNTRGRSRYRSFSDDHDSFYTNTGLPTESSPAIPQARPDPIPSSTADASKVFPAPPSATEQPGNSSIKKFQISTTAIVHTVPEAYRTVSPISTPPTGDWSLNPAAGLQVDEIRGLSSTTDPQRPDVDITTPEAESIITPDTCQTDQTKGSLIRSGIPMSGNAPHEIAAGGESTLEAIPSSQFENTSIPTSSSKTLTMAGEPRSSLARQDEKPDDERQPADLGAHVTVCHGHSIEDTHDLEPGALAMPTLTQPDISTAQFQQVLASGAIGKEESLKSFSLTPDMPMCITLGNEPLVVQSVGVVENYFNSLSDSFSDESTELLSDFVNATRLDMADCNESAIKELEDLIMAQFKDLTLESPDADWQAAIQPIYDRCKSLIEPEAPKQTYFGTFYSYFLKAPEAETVHPNFHLIASVAHILNGFPDYNTALSTEFKQQHQENLYPFRRKVIACMNVILENLDLENRFTKAVEQYAQPIHIHIEHGQESSNQVSVDEINGIVVKIREAIHHQVSAEQQKEGNLVTYESMQLPRQFLEKDLGRMHYQFNLEDDQTTDLPIQYEGTLDEKKESIFSALCKLTGNQEALIRQICFYATQDAHIGLLRAIEFNFIWRVYGPGFRFSGSDAIIKLSKDSASGNIIITYEFTRQPVSLLTHNFGNLVTMENLREGWDKALVRCEISIMIDPSDVNKPPTYLPLTADIDLP